MHIWSCCWYLLPVFTRLTAQDNCLENSNLPFEWRVNAQIWSDYHYVSMKDLSRTGNHATGQG